MWSNGLFLSDPSRSTTCGGPAYLLVPQNAGQKVSHFKIIILFTEFQWVLLLLLLLIPLLGIILRSGVVLLLRAAYCVIDPWLNDSLPNGLVTQKGNRCLLFPLPVDFLAILSLCWCRPFSLTLVRETKFSPPKFSFTSLNEIAYIGFLRSIFTDAQLIDCCNPCDFSTNASIFDQDNAYDRLVSTTFTWIGWYLYDHHSRNLA